MKEVLEIDQANTSEDVKLNFLIEQVTSWCEERLGRKFVQATRTEYYDGTGTQKLNLNFRPVYADVAQTQYPISVWVDDGGYYGAGANAFSQAALVYGTDFALKIDQPDGITSRAGYLIRIGKTWQKRSMRQGGLLSPFLGPNPGAIKVTYTGGYTIDTLPAVVRLATNILIAKLRQLLPLGFFLNSEGYQDRNVSYFIPHKRHLLAEWESMVGSFRNWKW